MKDSIGKTETSKLLPFRIGGVSIANPGSLNVQDFQFFRRENDRQPVEVPAYSAGDLVFVRFVMTGFKVGEKNAYRVSYEILVRPAAGWQAVPRPS